MPYDTFHLFPQLPTELRLQVWATSFPGPRVLEVTWYQEWTCVRESRPALNFSMCATREARRLFLESWAPLCAQQQQQQQSSDDPAEEEEEEEATVVVVAAYFNPRIDTLYIGAVTQLPSPLSSEALSALTAIDCVRELRFLAVEIREWWNFGLDFTPTTEWELDVFARFGKLEKLIIADYDIDWMWLDRGQTRPLGEIEFVEPTQIDPKNQEEMCVDMLQKFKDIAKRHPDMRLPAVTVKEVLRGGVRMTFN
jgi:hypothetical protein